MSTARGVFAGVLALSALQATVSAQANANRVGTFFTLGAGLINRLVNPSAALIPDRRAPKLKIIAN